MRAARPREKEGRGPVAFDLSPVTNAIDMLASRMDRAEERSALALTGITDALSAMASRLPRDGEGPKAGVTPEIGRQITTRVETLANRIDKMEHVGGADLQSLAGLEDSLRRLTVHMEERQGDAANAILAIEGALARLSSQVADLQTRENHGSDAIRERIFELSEQMDAIAAKADKAVKPSALAELEDKFEEKAGQALEKALDKALDKTLDEFSLRLEGVEDRSAEAIQALEQDMARLSTSLEALGRSGEIQAAGAQDAPTPDLDARLAALMRETGRGLDELRNELRDLSTRLASVEGRGQTPPQGSRDAGPADDTPQAENSFQFMPRPSSVDALQNPLGPDGADLLEAARDAAAEAAGDRPPEQREPQALHDTDDDVLADTRPSDDPREESHTAHAAPDRDPFETQARDWRTLSDTAIDLGAEEPRPRVGTLVYILAALAVLTAVGLGVTVLSPESGGDGTAPLSRSDDGLSGTTLPERQALPPGALDTPVASVPLPQLGEDDRPPGSVTPFQSVPDLMSAEPVTPGDANSGRALYEQALTLLREREDPAAHARAASLFEEAARAGLTVAWYRLGTLYQEGKGVPTDLVRARAAYERAAQGGNRRAMHNLGVLYAGGNGGPADDRRAAYWFEKSAELGVTDAQFNLAVLYLRGQGVAKDLLEAYRWFFIASSQGDPEAAGHRDQLARELGSQATATRVASARWVPRPMDLEANGLFQDENGLDDVIQAQALLERLGYRPGSVDGVMGPRTRDAIRTFERDLGLPVTGAVSSPLLSSLRRVTAERSGIDQF